MNNTFTLTIDGRSWQIPADYHTEIVRTLDAVYTDGTGTIMFTSPGQGPTMIYIKNPTTMSVTG